MSAQTFRVTGAVLRPPTLRRLPAGRPHRQSTHQAGSRLPISTDSSPRPSRPLPLEEPQLNGNTSGFFMSAAPFVTAPCERVAIATLLACLLVWRGADGADVAGLDDNPLHDANCERYPYMASLRDSSDKHHCNGVLVGDVWVLTAAHCVDSRADPHALGPHPIVKVGGCLLNDTEGTNENFETMIGTAASNMSVSAPL
ncbi:unnamed protein product [Ostreobium quekettii]|uniref:Peptidase S1 domain-containing protein n=1 Tax=Ostreobium quekettii TaxID=121088 RepID=A0A8S1J422_9CHLO|nr:unnamed protein product [Ostreobium quekettii]